MAEPGGRTILVINGRVLEVHPSRTAYRDDREERGEYLALLGGTLVALGASVAAGLGPEAAIGGVALFVAAGIAVGSERYGWATALGSAGVVWTAAGIAIYLGTDPSPGLSALACFAVGALALAVGFVGRLRPPHLAQPPTGRA